MKVNMALISDTDEKFKTTDRDVADTKAVDVDVGKDADADTGEGYEDEFDESDKHSKIKTFLLVAAMIGGFGLFVWNMTGIVNNMRLDNQGYAVNTVREMEDLKSFMNTGGSGSTTVSATEQESRTSTDTARDGPGSDDSGSGASGSSSYANESEEIKALRQEVQNARNEAALVKQELKNAEDMLDSSLRREEDLLIQIDWLSNGNSR